jgi:type IV secretory pathway protease TraF
VSGEAEVSEDPVLVEPHEAARQVPVEAQRGYIHQHLPHKKGVTMT